ncbi:hypothetical protein C810_00666 [Lachnospiraceae bacterium A2]|nr:hypothetical protein C810_00666 [Lachnospiraceae bacterium A2]
MNYAFILMSKRGLRGQAPSIWKGGQGGWWCNALRHGKGLRE